MDTNGNGHNSITSSTPILSEGKANLLKQQQAQQHGSGSTRLNVIVKPNNGLRKMSTMPEEEDGTDELDSDVIKTPQQQQQQHHHQHQHDVDSDSTYEERGRLLSSASNKKITITPSSTVSNVSREACCNGVRRSGSGHNSSTDSVQEKVPPRTHQQSEFRLLPYRDTGCVQQLPGSGRITRGLDLQGGGRHLRYPSMRSLKSNATIDENNYLQQMNHQNHHHQHHHLSCHHHNCQNPNHWTSFVFTDGQGPASMARTIPSSVSIRSLASIGMGSSDGRKLTIRRVPTSPSELLNMMHPQTPIEDDISTYTSFDDCDADDPGDYRQPRRPHWANKSQFVLACISYSIGLGNVWRFPYLCYKSGGGVFLVPYFLILIVCGVPLLYMELSIGQFTRRGPIGALGQLCPLLKGAGLSSVVISFLMSTYHNMIIAYAIYYLFAAFRSDIPWADCDNSWNSPECWVAADKIIDNRTRPNNSITPSEDFFNNKVLRISGGIEEPGNLRWDLVACLVSAWVLVYFSIWKSIKSSAQVRYLTATLPFVLIVVFLMRSLTLEGADKGLQFFFHPRWELLGDAKVWVNAAAQIFTSVGIAFGSMICFASYNKFHNTILVDTVAVSLINAFSCLLVGIFSFATIGNIAKEHNTSVEAVLSDGPGLVFVLYPQALAKMPASQLWGVLFFFMLVCLSLNSQFAIVEVVVTSIQDGFPNWVKRNLLCHEVLVFLVCVVSFICGLPNTTQGGIYFFQLIDHYAASLSIMFLAFFEVIAISWFYGVRRLCSNVKEMTGRVPSTYIQFCWKIAAPSMILAVWVFSLIDYEPPTFHNGEYEYPGWAEALGWAIASLSLICIPAFAVYVLVKAEGNTFLEKLRNSVKPYFEACKICGQEYCTEPIHNFEEDMLKDTQEMPSSPLHANYLITSKPSS